MAEQNDDNAKPLVNVEVAGSDSGRDITRGYLEGLRLQDNDDGIIKLKGRGSLELYEQLAADDQIKIALQQRQLGLISREWYIEAGAEDAASQKAADFAKELLGRISWDDITRKMLMGVWYGYAVGECLWARDGAHVTMECFKVRRTRRFAFAPGRELRLLTSGDPQGEALPPRKFWTFSVGADDDDEPYGRGLGYWSYWPWWFKRNALKFWLVYLEKFAMPTPVGKHPPGADKTEINKLLSALRAFYRDSAVAISDNMVIELMEAQRNSGGDFDQFTQRMDDVLARLILGQSFSVNGSGGQYKGDNLMDVRADLIKADADVINHSFCRGPLRWLTEWNFPGAAVPRVWRRVEGQPDLKDMSETHRNLYQLGYRPTLEEISEQYGGEWEEVQAPAGPMPPNAKPGTEDATAEDDGTPNPATEDAAEQADAEMAEGDSPNLSDDADQSAARLGREAEPLIRSGLLAPIAAAMDQAIAEGKTLAEFQAALGEIYAQLDARDLAEMMGRAMFCADLGGRFDVRAETADE